LLKHRKIHEKKPKKPSEPDADQSEPEEPKRKKALPGQEKYKFSFKCTADGCRKSYKVKEFLEAHMRVHEGVEVSDIYFWFTHYLMSITICSQMSATFVISR
jgi:hypothetical protein